MSSNIRSLIESRFGGVLQGGKHVPDGQACALEAASVARGVKWTDKPELVGLPDLRPINDGPWLSDQARTEALVPMLDALWGWPEWPEERRVAWAQAVARRTIGEVLPVALRAVGLEAEAARCEREPTADVAVAAARMAAARVAAEAARAAAVAAAEAAAEAAWAAAVAAAEAAARMAAEAVAAVAAVARMAAEAARVAAEAARAAAEAARAAVAAEADSDAILQLACRIWIEAAQESAA